MSLPFELRQVIARQIVPCFARGRAWPGRGSTFSNASDRIRTASLHSNRSQFEPNDSSSQTPVSPSTQDDATRPLVILGLESSADDTCAAILRSRSRTSRPELLSNVVLKQGAIHEKFGGIHPLHAQEAHHRAMPLAISRALREAGVGVEELDAVAFTRGPGMWGGLAVSMGAAKTLKAVKPELLLVGAHHMQAHALTPSLTEETPPAFPFLTLLVSGGHTLLLLARSESDFTILATAQDESIGMSFDKACRDLAIPWSVHPSGAPGAALAEWANLPTSPTKQKGQESPFTLPLRGKLAFSFSGLRSALTRIIAAEPVADMPEERNRQLANMFVTAAVGQVEEKVRLAINECGTLLSSPGGGEVKLQAIVASGGVASNSFLRMRLRHTLDSLGLHDLPLVFPPPALCTDNAAMIANVGLSRIRRGRTDGMEVMPRAKWSIELCEDDFETRNGQ